MRMGNDHNQMMNELEQHRRVLNDIRDLLQKLVDLQTYSQEEMDDADAEAEALHAAIHGTSDKP